MSDKPRAGIPYGLRNEPPSPQLAGEVSKELRIAIERVRDLAGPKLQGIRIEVRYHSGAGQFEQFGGVPL